MKQRLEGQTRDQRQGDVPHNSTEMGFNKKRETLLRDVNSQWVL